MKGRMKGPIKDLMEFGDSHKKLILIEGVILYSIFIILMIITPLSSIIANGIDRLFRNTININTTSIIILTIIICIIAYGSVVVALWQASRISSKLAVGEEPSEETNNELLIVEKQRLELEKKKTQVEREQQIIGWQKEALAVVQVSPRAAIVIAWIGIEQELNRIARKFTLLLQPGSNIVSPSSIIEALNKAGYLNRDESGTLRRMLALRSKVVHGVDESAVPSTEEAISYIQEAINITQKLTSIEE